MNVLPARIAQLKKQGFRLTKLRSAMLRVLTETARPMSAAELTEKLGLSPTPHKTSLYRELDFFVAQAIVQAVDFNDGVRRFEMRDRHHHHLICRLCKTVRDVELPETLFLQEKKIAKLFGFRDVEHSLEFFGLCTRCAARA